VVTLGAELKKNNMYGKPFKMMGKSPMMKKLIGKQENLPEELKAKIKASPAKGVITDELLKSAKQMKEILVDSVIGRKVKKGAVSSTVKAGIKAVKKSAKKKKQGEKKDTSASSKIVTPVIYPSKRVDYFSKEAHEKRKKARSASRQEDTLENEKKRKTRKTYKKDAPMKNYKKGYYGA